MKPAVTPAAIEEAAARTIATRTAVERSVRLSERYAAEVLLKREDLQLGRSYKVRGAYNLMSSLTPEELERGVVCASAGNHAQGVAISLRPPRGARPHRGADQHAQAEARPDHRPRRLPT